MKVKSEVVQVCGHDVELEVCVEEKAKKLKVMQYMGWSGEKRGCE